MKMLNYHTFISVFMKIKFVNEHKTNPSTIELDFLPNTSRGLYDKAINKIHQAIEQGLTKQVNYTIRLIAKYENINLDNYYQQLSHAQQANFTAHLQFPEFAILSISPELFFAWDGEIIETRPMKGTIQRGRHVAEDIHNKEQLINSSKDKNENKMIVNLMKEELLKIATPETITISKLFDIETYPTVYQMTSTLKAKTKENTTLLSIFESLFPCASVTGSPKISTMRLIKKLETSAREVYCGAIGIVTPDNKAIFNVPIRTLWFDHIEKKATYGVGGGITSASSSVAEYQEIIAKSKVLKYKAPQFELLETMKLENGHIFLLDYHLKRIKKSAHFFSFKYDERLVFQKMNELKRKNKLGIYRLRLRIGKNGTVKIDLHELNLTSQIEIVTLAKQPINKKSPYYYHKTTYRHMYEMFKIEGYDDTLLWNEDGYVTEFINGNVVYQINDQKFTPPVDDGLLAGTFRKFLLENGQLTEKSLHKDELNQVEKLWLINSVREWVEVNLKNN